MMDKLVFKQMCREIEEEIDFLNLMMTQAKKEGPECWTAQRGAVIGNICLVALERIQLLTEEVMEDAAHETAV